MTHLQCFVMYSDRKSWEFPTWVSGVAAITCGLPKSIDIETHHMVTQFCSLTRLGSLQAQGVFHFSISTAGMRYVATHLKAFPLDRGNWKTFEAQIVDVLARLLWATVKASRKNTSLKRQVSCCSSFEVSVQEFGELLLSKH